MRTLILFTALLLTACNEGESSKASESSTPSRDPIFKAWTVPSPNERTIDLGTAVYGSSSVQVSYPSGASTTVCSCAAVIAGDVKSGTVDVGNCSKASGPGTCPTGTVFSFDALIYDFTAGTAVSSTLDGSSYK